jgi:hypothetical protein
MRRRILAVAFVVAIVLGACGVGISRDQAIKLALGPTTAKVLSAQAGPLGHFTDRTTLPEEPRDRQVWAVLLSGRFPVSCVAGIPCPPDATQQLVILDYRTGDLILSETR